MWFIMLASAVVRVHSADSRAAVAVSGEDDCNTDAGEEWCPKTATCVAISEPCLGGTTRCKIVCRMAKNGVAAKTFFVDIHNPSTEQRACNCDEVDIEDEATEVAVATLADLIEDPYEEMAEPCRTICRLRANGAAETFMVDHQCDCNLVDADALFFFEFGNLQAGLPGHKLLAGLGVTSAGEPAATEHEELFLMMDVGELQGTGSGENFLPVVYAHDLVQDVQDGPAGFKRSEVMGELYQVDQAALAALQDMYEDFGSELQAVEVVSLRTGRSVMAMMPVMASPAMLEILWEAAEPLNSDEDLGVEMNPADAVAGVSPIFQPVPAGNWRNVAMPDDGARHQVFVYGQMLTGYKHHSYLEGSTPLSKSCKTDKQDFVLLRSNGESVADSLAFGLKDHHDGKLHDRGLVPAALEGELYEVSTATLNVLDALQSNGVLYQRVVETVLPHIGGAEPEATTAWVYLIEDGRKRGRLLDAASSVNFPAVSSNDWARAAVLETALTLLEDDSSSSEGSNSAI